jgi:hypothetical protein
MRFPKKGQKDTINYNSNSNSKITITNIPEKAYEYIVNGKSAIEWIMERYQITTHKVPVLPITRMIGRKKLAIHDIFSIWYSVSLQLA